MRIAICDDDTDFLLKEKNVIKNVLEDNFEAEEFEVDIYDNGDRLVHEYEKYMYELILLDIEIGKQSGFDVAERIVLINQDVIIVFVTSHENLVYEAFRFRPVGFMVKQRFATEFRRELHKIIKKLIDTRQVIEIDGKRFCTDNIIWLTTYKRKIYLRSMRGEISIADTYSKYVSNLENIGFVEVSKGIVINMRYINRIREDDIIMYDGEKVAISRRKKKSVIEKYENYLFNKM